MSSISDRSIKSFTLVELLIVIAILAVLAAAVVIVLNPAELLAQARDSQRISDLESLKKSVDIFIVDNPTVSLGTESRVYISLPDTASNCPNLTATLPSLPSGWQYVCVTAANLRNTNGTGWVPINFNNIYGGSLIPYLPIDPQNDSSLTKYYQYIPGTSTFELTALMESEKQSKAAAKDGGIDAGRLEVGSDVSLWRAASKIIGYWNMDGIIGPITDGQSLFPDLSGTGNNGVSVNVNGSGMNFAEGKTGQAIQLDGSDDKIEIPYSSTFDCTSGVTVTAWIKTTDASGNILSKYGISGSGLSYMLVIGPNASGIVDFYNQGWRRGTRVVNNNAWHHVAGSTDGTTWKVYSDGQLDASGGAAPISISGSTTAIGGPNSNSWGGYFGGLIDEVLVYCRVLSDNEVRAIYNSGK